MDGFFLESLLANLDKLGGPWVFISVLLILHILRVNEKREDRLITVIEKQESTLEEIQRTQERMQEGLERMQQNQERLQDGLTKLAFEFEIMRGRNRD